MKHLKRIFILIFAFAMCLSIVACDGGDTPCTEHKDDDGNLICDVCEAALENNESGGGVTADGELSLIANGKANFRIVKGANISAEANKKISELKRNLAAIGIEIDVVYEADASTMDCEVLVGEVTTRGEDCIIDKHTLGPEGYMVKKVGTKIVVLGGAEDALADAVDAFIGKILGYKASTESLTNVTMKDDDSIVKPQENFRVSYIKINDTDIRDYTIAADKTNADYHSAAKKLQNVLYEKAGYWLEIVPLADADKSIIIKSVSDAGSTGFRAYINSQKQLLVECAYDNMFVEAFDSFTATTFSSKFAPINLKNTKGILHTENVSMVYYDDFGAKGDGVTNDFFAMQAAHNFANQGGQTVVATPGKTYLISRTVVSGGKEANSITIKTNTVWTNATIVIDDRDIFNGSGTNEYATNIFNVQPQQANYSLSKDQIAAINEYEITRDTKKLNVTFDSEVLIRITNNTHKTYIRWGGNANDGKDQSECFYVYPDGTISDTTPFMHDFSTVTSVYVTRANLPELTIEGGTVITRASNVNTTVNGVNKMVYFSRGLAIQRSNTTIKNLDHQVTDELEFIEGKQTGPAYSGFFSGGFASHITIDSCILSARKYYKIAGTYDFGASMSNEITLKNCTMHKFYLENGKISTTGNAYWGVGGTNYCKNMSYINCELTRYDAHSGVYNGKIIGGKIGLINLIGAGDMLIEDVTIVQQNRIFYLRNDYGSTWNGTVTVRNVTLDNTGNVTICGSQWVNHYFGYDCYFPNIVVENLRLVKPNVNIDVVGSAGQYTNSQLATLPNGNENVNIPIAPISLIVKDAYNYNYVFPTEDATFFKDTVMIYNEEEQ